MIINLQKFMMDFQQDALNNEQPLYSRVPLIHRPHLFVKTLI